MQKLDYLKLLTEASVEVNRVDFFSLSEDAKFQVTDDTLTQMMKFITDRYNQLDFAEIERSAGDIQKFKYLGILWDNVKTLQNIYQNSSDPGARRYLEVIGAVERILKHLEVRRRDYMDLYKAGNGVVQLLYTSLVAGCVYAMGVLVSNTIRFVTTETETDCQVLFDEIPGTIKHVHIKNVLAAANDLETVDKLLTEYTTKRTQRAMHEAAISGGMIAVGVVAGVIILLPRIVVLIREIIYSIYFSRVKVHDMLAVQIDLINTNIESLETTGRGNKKIIAKQRRIADKLEKWKNKVALKMDSTTTLVSAQKQKEAAALKLDRNSPIMQDPASYDAGELLL